MVAYHYPPEGSSSGVQRTLTYSKYLEESGWNPIVLTAHPRAYSVTRNDQLDDVPEGVVVRRAFALDAGRHLAIGGRYPRLAALPDRWVSWWLGAVISGWRLVREFRPSVLWSTYPIATAHMIGLSLHRLTGLPWIADFRDSMTEDGYPSDPRQWRWYRRIEQKSVAAAARSVFTAPGARRMYQRRYPENDESHFAIIPNGYEEASYSRLERRRTSKTPGNQLVLLHSGSLYPSERDPRAFYRALARLLTAGRIDSRAVRIVLRSTGHDEHHRRLIDDHGIGAVVELAPRLPYADALEEMLDVDGLLVFQASNCNHQVPAKIYEYMRARTPILALTDPEGDTAGALRDASVGSIVPLDDDELIAKGLLEFLDDIRSGKAGIASDEEIAKHSRRARTHALAELLDDVVGEGSS